MVEHHLAKVGAAGSNPVSRSFLKSFGIAKAIPFVLSGVLHPICCTNPPERSVIASVCRLYSNIEHGFKALNKVSNLLYRFISAASFFTETDMPLCVIIVACKYLF